MATPNRAGSENTPAPTMPPTTMAVSVGMVIFATPLGAASTTGVLVVAHRAHDRRGSVRRAPSPKWGGQVRSTRFEHMCDHRSMRGGYGSGEHGTLAERVAGTAPQQQRPPTPASPARHCFVDGEPSLLVEWRRARARVGGPGAHAALGRRRRLGDHGALAPGQPFPTGADVGRPEVPTRGRSVTRLWPRRRTPWTTSAGTARCRASPRGRPSATRAPAGPGT